MFARTELKFSIDIINILPASIWHGLVARNNVNFKRCLDLSEILYQSQL